jgi:hypothetical protein
MKNKKIAEIAWKIPEKNHFTLLWQIVEQVANHYQIIL